MPFPLCCAGANAKLVEDLLLVDLVVELNSITTERQVANRLAGIERRGISRVFALVPASGTLIVREHRPARGPL